MKLITAIINKKDESFLSNALTERGFYHTRISTNGGFLRKKIRNHLTYNKIYGGHLFWK